MPNDNNRPGEPRGPQAESERDERPAQGSEIDSGNPDPAERSTDEGKKE